MKLTKNVSTTKALTNILIAYQQSDEGFVADKVFPEVRTTHDYGTYFLFGKNAWNQKKMQKRADGSEAPVAKWDCSKQTFDTDQYSLAVDTTYKEINNADDVLMLEDSNILFLSNQEKINREIVFGTTFFKTGVWTGSSTGTDIVVGTKWDAAGSDPISDVKTQMTAMQKKTGIRPNCLTVSQEVFDVLEQHPVFVDRVKYTSDKSVSIDIMKELFGVSYLYIAGGTYIDDAGDGQFVFGKHALLSFKTERPRRDFPSAGYTFMDGSLEGSRGTGKVIETPLKIETRRVVRYEINSSFGMKVAASDLGVFFNGVIS